MQKSSNGYWFSELAYLTEEHRQQETESEASSFNIIFINVFAIIWTSATCSLIISDKRCKVGCVPQARDVLLSSSLFQQDVQRATDESQAQYKELGGDIQLVRNNYSYNSHKPR